MALTGSVLERLVDDQRSGVLMIVATSCAFWCMPRDSSAAFLFMESARPTSVAAHARVRVRGVGNPRSAPKCERLEDRTSR